LSPTALDVPAMGKPALAGFSKPPHIRIALLNSRTASLLDPLDESRLR
jgi:hypothetical protein